MIRELCEKDAPLMLEWMHDSTVTRYLSQNFRDKTLEDCLEFIERARSDSKESRHFAIVNEEDEYIGTISLKNIDYVNNNAEYAISIRAKAKGTGIAQNATREILKIAFEELHLEHVYLCVLSLNERAINFYKKCDFEHEGTLRKHHKDIDGKYCDMLWFGKVRSDTDFK